MPDVFFTFGRHLRKDGENGRFRRLLLADYHAANLKQLRQILVHLLALAAIALCVAEWFPHEWAMSFRSRVAGAAVVIGVVTLFVAVAEARWTRRRSRLADELSDQDRS